MMNQIEVPSIAIPEIISGRFLSPGRSYQRMSTSYLHFKGIFSVKGEKRKL